MLFRWLLFGLLITWRALLRPCAVAMLLSLLLFRLLITGRVALEAVPLNDARSCVLQHKIVHAVVTRTRHGLDILKNAENSPILRDVFSSCDDEWHPTARAALVWHHEHGTRMTNGMPARHNAGASSAIAEVFCANVARYA